MEQKGKTCEQRNYRMRKLWAVTKSTTLSSVTGYHTVIEPMSCQTMPHISTRDSSHNSCQVAIYLTEYDVFFRTLNMTSECLKTLHQNIPFFDIQTKHTLPQWLQEARKINRCLLERTAGLITSMEPRELTFVPKFINTCLCWLTLATEAHSY